MGRGATASPATAAHLRGAREDLLSRRETADLAELSLGAINKAIEQRVIRFQRGQRRQLFIPATEVAALVMLKRIEIKLPTTVKKQIRDWTVAITSGESSSRELPLASVLVLRLDPEVERAAKQALDYARSRSQYLESNPEIKGGEPVIKGTRITASAIAARLAGGDTIDAIAGDYDYVDRRALEAAAIYGRTHPRQGRPPRPSRPE